MKSEIILSILWIVYGVFHSLTATESFKNLLKSVLGRFSIYYRLIYNTLAVVLILPIIKFQLDSPTDLLLEQSIMNQILGGLMMGSGIFLGFSALKQYDLSEFLGTDALKDSTKKKQELLIKDELSSIVRHPLYLGILIFLWGAFGFFGTSLHLVTAISLTFYIRIGIHFEEKRLVKEFGKQYEKYQKEVPMLIPKISDGK
ncbi:isoprenylcysteine carboxylmethyltransferase family protein [Arcicella sp. DC2W]|uniref:Isoprenylcysteine carboxylmethyltransferase family protein n=1 Tax=Arcicella gelida TaxID=2984195 RepID=A0ABU5S629_9BACT|nr:isoprenylcysteine carboxylmethyltransferase family protein [Arcicella sp. DC2W]MEA5403698.1 isoprenylcysteine carboxylmethyltransferase family protein [Arcicella sp. DC2W]